MKITIEVTGGNEFIEFDEEALKLKDEAFIYFLQRAENAIQN
jgi:hypothetical protein